MKSTADRMRARKASIGCLPTTPAQGKMPFQGHRNCYENTWRFRPEYRHNIKPRLVPKRLAEYGYGQ